MLEWIQTSLRHTKGCRWLHVLPKLFFDRCVSKSLPPECLGHRWRMPNVDIICKCCLLSRRQHRSWLGCCSPQQLPSKVYAQGFLISSLRAAVSAAVFTTAVGKLNTNLEGSICCPGGLRDRLILCISHYKTLCSLPRAALHSSVDGEGKVAKAMNGAHHWLCIYGLPSFKNIAFQIDLMPKKLVQRRSGKL